MHQCGLPENWTFGEIYGFEEDLLAFIPTPVKAVIINAEVLNKQTDRAKGDRAVVQDFYMKQTGTLDNACGVIACIHAILNNLGEGDDKIKLNDGVLKNFLENTRTQTPEERATSLETFTEFQQVHQGQAAQGQSNQASEQSEVKHHFIAYTVNSAGQLIELDGCKQGPCVVTENCEDVLRGAVAEIQRKLGAQEISESLSMITLNGTG